MKKLLVILAVLSFAGAAFAQSANKVSEILKSAHLTYAQAAYLSQAALGNETSEDEAFSAAQRSGAIPKGCSATDEITLKNLAWVCSKTWSVDGSLMLKAFNNPRYTFRQMKADGVFDQNADPDKKPSGGEAMNIITNCIDIYEGGAK